MCSHLGRPEGRTPAFAMAAVAARLRELLPGERVRVLENTRFDPGETRSDRSRRGDLLRGWTCT